MSAFGRPRAADQSSWRVVSSSNTSDGSALQGQPVVLDVTSRSPPPDLVRTVRVEHTVSSNDSSIKAPAKNRGPRMSLDGNDVAFYRDLRKASEDSQEGGSAPVVSFTVSSELEVENSQSPQGASSLLVESLGMSSVSAAKAESIVPALVTDGVSTVSSVLPLASQSGVTSQVASPKGSENRLQEQVKLC